MSWADEDAPEPEHEFEDVEQFVRMATQGCRQAGRCHHRHQFAGREIQHIAGC